MRETTEFRVKVIKDLINLYHRVCVTNSVNRIESDLRIEVGDECLESLEMLFDQILPISKNRSVSATEKISLRFYTEMPRVKLRAKTSYFV